MRTMLAVLLLSGLVIWPLSLAWHYFAARNAESLGMRRLTYSPPMHVVSWMIPVLNVALPLACMRDLYDASSAHRRADGAMFAAVISFPFATWWAGVLLRSSALGFILRFGLTTPGVDLFLVLGSALYALYYPRLLQEIDALQHERAAG